MKGGGELLLYERGAATQRGGGQGVPLPLLSFMWVDTSLTLLKIHSTMLISHSKIPTFYFFNKTI
jgi:hypothetical protein